MGQQPRHFMNEADIGSGEKSPGQADIERDQKALNGQAGTVPEHDRNETQNEMPGRTLRRGTHLARILAVAQPDGTFEAQVYVRLTREPELAETYIPAGTFPSELEAWAAAEERANRAFKEQEF